MKVEVRLNGTTENPYLRLGTTRNPFPAIPRAEFAAANRILARLASEPIPPDRAEAHIREVMTGCAPAFIDECVRRYRPGKIVVFEVHFPAP